MQCTNFGWLIDIPGWLFEFWPTLDTESRFPLSGRLRIHTVSSNRPVFLITSPGYVFGLAARISSSLPSRPSRRHQKAREARCPARREKCPFVRWRVLTWRLHRRGRYPLDLLPVHASRQPLQALKASQVSLLLRGLANFRTEGRFRGDKTLPYLTAFHMHFHCKIQQLVILES